MADLTLERLQKYVKDCAAEIVEWGGEFSDAVHEYADGSEFIIYGDYDTALLAAGEELGVDLDKVWNEYGPTPFGADTWTNLQGRMAYGVFVALLNEAVKEAEAASA